MSKRQRTRKKRDKAYSGADAAPSQPVIRRYHAEIKSPAKEWWDAKKGPLKIISIVTGLVVFLGWLLIEFLMLVF